MREITQSWFNELFQQHQAPCVSIYVPTHRAAPPSNENGPRYRECVQKAEAQMRRRWDDATVRRMGERLLGVLGDPGLGAGGRDGVAVFCAGDHLHVVDLQAEPQHPIEELVIVADSFHVKPLIRVLQSADRFHLLCLEVKEVRLFEGNQYRLEPVEVKNVPQDPMTVAGMRVSKDVDSATDLQASPRMQSQGPGAPVEGVPVEVFFRAVDKAIWENHSRPSKLPLIVCADAKYVSVFLDHSANPQLLKQGIAINPHRQPLDRLHAEAWKIIEPSYRAGMEKLKDDFRAAKAHRQGSDELMEVAGAASCGRVGTLLVQSDAQVKGILQRGDGFIRQTDATHPSDDVLDDLAEMVLQMDGRVVVLPRDGMPTDTGVAAIYRY